MDSLILTGWCQERHGVCFSGKGRLHFLPDKRPKWILNFMLKPCCRNLFKIADLFCNLASSLWRHHGNFKLIDSFIVGLYHQTCSAERCLSHRSDDKGLPDILISECVLSWLAYTNKLPGPGVELWTSGGLVARQATHTAMQWLTTTPSIVKTAAYLVWPVYATNSEW